MRMLQHRQTPSCKGKTASLGLHYSERFGTCTLCRAQLASAGRRPVASSSCPLSAQLAAAHLMSQLH